MLGEAKLIYEKIFRSHDERSIEIKNKTQKIIIKYCCDSNFKTRTRAQDFRKFTSWGLLKFIVQRSWNNNEKTVFFHS